MPDWTRNNPSFEGVKRAAHDSVVEQAFKAMGDNSSSDDDSAVTMPPIKLSLRATRGRCAKAVASPAYLRRVFPDYETTMVGEMECRRYPLESSCLSTASWPRQISYSRVDEHFPGLSVGIGLRTLSNGAMFGREKAAEVRKRQSRRRQ